MWVYAFLLIALAYVFGLFIDLTGDSGLYAAISRQMVESGDWLNLRINGQPYDQKPHLFFWLAGLGIQLFGNTNFAFKLFPFLYGVAGIYFTYRLGKQLFSVDAGKFAALIAATSQLFFLYFFDYHTDTVMQTGVVFSLWQLAAYLQTKKIANFIMGFTGVGLAMLSKGPIGAVIPFLSVLLFLVVKRDFRQLFHPKWFLGILITVIIISPSLIHLYRNFGFEGLRFYFITNNFGRITGEYAGSSTDYFFYVHTSLWAFLPWTIYMVAALFLEIRSWFQGKKISARGIYLLGSALILILILSVAKGKAPNYFLISFSPLAVIAGNWLNRFTDLSPKMRSILIRAQEILAGLIFLMFAVFVFIFSNQKIWISVLLVTVSAIPVIYTFYLHENKLKRIVLILVIIAATLNLYFNAGMFPSLFQYQGARQVLNLFMDKSASESNLYNLDIEEYALFFYARQPVENIENWDELRMIVSNPGAWIYTNEIDYKEMMFQKFPIDTVYQIKQRGMNRVNFKFLNPKTREQALITNYLIVTGKKKNE